MCIMLQYQICNASACFSLLLSLPAQLGLLKLEINVLDGLSLTFIFIILMLSTLHQLSDNEVHARRTYWTFIYESNLSARLVLLTLCLL